MVLLISYKFCKPPLVYLQDYFLQHASLLIRLFPPSNQTVRQSLFFDLQTWDQPLMFSNMPLMRPPPLCPPVTATPTRPSATWRPRPPAVTVWLTTSRPSTCTSWTCVTPCGAVGPSAVPTNTPSRCSTYSGRFHRADRWLPSTVSPSVNIPPCWVWLSGF